MSADLKPNPEYIKGFFAILVAIITAVATLYTGGVIGPKAPTPIPPTLMPSSTFVPTLLPATATVTPSPFSTEILPIATENGATATLSPTPIALGQDWLNDCISTKWQVYAAEGLVGKPGTDCWLQPVADSISTSNGSLQIFHTGFVKTALYRGLLANLPAKSEIRFTLRVNQSTLSETELWFMILPEDDPLVSGIKFSTVVANPQKGKMQFDFKTGSSAFRTQYLPENNGVYKIVIQIDNGNARISINSVSFGPYPIAFVDRKLFIGYRPLPAPSFWIDAVFTDFSIE
jgi:hypothetical protein